MTYPKIKPAGYGFNDVVTSAQFNTLNDIVPALIDTVGGGTYNPSGGVIQIGGQGLALAGTNHQVTGTLTVNNGAFLTFASGSLITSNAKHVGAWTFGDGSVGVGHAATVTIAVNSALAINGVTTIHANLAADNSTWVLAGTIVNMGTGAELNLSAGQMNVANCAVGFDASTTITMNGVVVGAGIGRWRQRYVVGPDANHTFNVGDGDIFDGSGNSGANTWTVGTTGAAAGDVMQFVNNGVTGLAINYGPTTTIRSVAGAIRSIILVYTGSFWRSLHGVPS